MPSIVIDAGHGGHSPLGGSSPIGARGASGTREKDVTLDLAQRVCARLGGDAALTRTGDVNLSLAERAHMARRYGARVFVTLHANAGSPDHRGAQTWIHGRSGYGSRRLAGTVQGALTRVGSPDGGVFAGDFGVLRPEALGSDVDACLVEVDYLSHPDGERTLTDPRSAERIASAIANAVRGHLDGSAYGTPAGMFQHYAPGATTLDTLDVPRLDWSDWRVTLGELARWAANRHRYENVPVENTNQYPFNAICKIETSAGMGSGFFVGPNTILTAGHVLTDRSGNKERELTVYQGLNDNRSSVSAFSVAPADFDAHPRYRSGSQDFDLGVIRTGGNASVFYLNIEEQVMNPLSGVIICGYAYGQDVQRIDTDSIRVVHDETYAYRAETRGGTSGSPVFYVDGETAIATGVHISGVDMRDQPSSGEVNVGCRLTVDKLAWIRSNAGHEGIAQYGGHGRASARPFDALAPPSVDWHTPGDALRRLGEWLLNRLRYEAIPVQNTREFPFNAICKIETSAGMGSGYFIGPNTILTAAHVVTGVSGATVYPALNDDKAAVSGFSVSGTAIVSHPSIDVAVIRTGSNESADYFQLEELRFSPQNGVAICGYADGADVQRVDTDTIRELSNGEFAYSAETRGGTSGSPVFYTDGTNAIAVGVHVSGRGGARSNTGVRLTDALVQWLASQADSRGISETAGYGAAYGSVSTHGAWERYGGSPAQAQDAGATATLIGVGWSVIAAALQGSDSDISWSLARMDGAKHPNDDQGTYDHGPWTRASALVEHTWTGIDDIGAAFELRFQHNGSSVGFVEVVPVATNDAVGFGLSVTGTIQPDPNTWEVGGGSNLAMVQVNLQWRYTRTIGAEGLFESTIKLYGNGHVDKRTVAHQASVLSARPQV